MAAIRQPIQDKPPPAPYPLNSGRSTVASSTAHSMPHLESKMGSDVGSTTRFLYRLASMSKEYAYDQALRWMWFVPYIQTFIGYRTSSSWQSTLKIKKKRLSLRHLTYWTNQMSNKAPSAPRMVCVSCLENCDAMLSVGQCGHEFRVYYANPNCSKFIPSFAIKDDHGTCPAVSYVSGEEKEKSNSCSFHAARIITKWPVEMLSAVIENLMLSLLAKRSKFLLRGCPVQRYSPQQPEKKVGSRSSRAPRTSKDTSMAATEEASHDENEYNNDANIFYSVIGNQYHWKTHKFRSTTDLRRTYRGNRNKTNQQLCTTLSKKSRFLEATEEEKRFHWPDSTTFMVWVLSLLGPIYQQPHWRQ